MAFSAALLVKGVFVAIPLLAAGIWVVANPLRAPGSAWRAVAAALAGLAMMAGVAFVYDSLYRHVTGQTFWGPYWGRQLAPLTISAPGEAGSTFGAHLRFYLVRLIWHPAPWSLALVAGVWRWWGTLGRWWRTAPVPARAGPGLRARVRGRLDPAAQPRQPLRRALYVLGQLRDRGGRRGGGRARLAAVRGAGGRSRRAHPGPAGTLLAGADAPAARSRAVPPADQRVAAAHWFVTRSTSRGGRRAITSPSVGDPNSGRLAATQSPGTLPRSASYSVLAMMAQPLGAFS